MIAESDARRLELRKEAEDERALYEEQVRLREMEIQRLHQGVRAADKNGYESQNAARVATSELASAQAQTVVVAPLVAIPPPPSAGSPPRRKGIIE